MPRARKTHDEFRLFGKYAAGWEEVTCELTREQIRKRYREYVVNQPGVEYKWTGPHRVKNDPPVNHFHRTISLTVH